MGVSENSLLLSEALDLISCTTVVGVLYGIAFSLYCLCAWSSHRNLLQKPDKRHLAKLSLGFTSILFICATAELAFNSRVIQLTYVNHSNFPGGPIQYEFSRSPILISYDTAAGVLDFVIEVLTMAVQIWRLWVIWSGTQYAIAVIILPLLLLLSYIALAIPVSIVVNLVSFEQLGISQRTVTAMATATFAVQSGVTIIVTGLIVARLLLARRQYMKIMGVSDAATPYLGIVAMLIESYALQSAWSLGAAISLGLLSPSRLLFSTNDSNVKIIAFFLIVYRVETGRGWTKQTAGNISSLQWNHGTQAANDEVSGARSRLPPTTTMVMIDSPPITHPDSVV